MGGYKFLVPFQPAFAAVSNYHRICCCVAIVTFKLYCLGVIGRILILNNVVCEIINNLAFNNNKRVSQLLYILKKKCF